MNKISIFFFAMVCFCFTAYATPKYELVDLGLQESDRSEALAINDNGQIVGTYWIQGKKYFFIWSKKTGISLIDLPETSTVVVLNNFGQIAGNYKNHSGNKRGFFWDPCCGFFDIGSLGGNFTRVYDMNDFGQVVGKSETSSHSLITGKNERHAYLWQVGVMTDLGTLTSGDLGLAGDESAAFGINNHGITIGSSNCTVMHKGKPIRSELRATIWVNGQIEEFDSSFEGEIRLQSINNDGFILCHISPRCEERIASGNFAIDAMPGNASVVSRNKASFSTNTAGFPNYENKTHGLPKMNNANILYRQAAYFFLGNDTSHRRSYPVYGNRIDLPKMFREITAYPWKNFVRANDINENNWIVGAADNIYGERHAILLVPAN